MNTNTKNNHKKHWDTRGRSGTVGKNGYRSFVRGKRVERIRKYEHRMIMEQYLERKLTKDEVVHHINGNKLDNRIENLELTNRKKHNHYHAIKNKLGKDRRGISPINKTNQRMIDEIIKLRKEGIFLKNICKLTNLSYPTVQKYAKY